MMPQKRNPDLAELVRGRAAHGIGDLTTILTLLKGLPLAYDRDLQEDKGPLFSTADRLVAALEAATSLVRELNFDVEKLRAAAEGGAAWATDVAEALVARGVPFRRAHEAVGSLVAQLEQRGISLAEADEALLKDIHPAFESSDARLGDPRTGVQARRHLGGPSPEAAAVQIGKLRTAVRELL